MQQSDLEEGRNELDEIRSEAESILKELGLSSHAARSLLVITENSPLAATSVCQKTGIADSKIYYALKELEEKGLVVRTAGTPQLYSALKSDETYEVLRNELESERSRKETRLARLEKILRPLSKASRKSDNLELAYIARGFDSVVRRAGKLLESAEKEVVGYIWDREFYRSLATSLKDLESREVKTRLALNPSFLKDASKSKGMSLPLFTPSRGKVLTCECNLLVADARKMISVTKTRGDSYYAIITEDPGMVALGTSYYDNPSCCATM